MVWKQRCVDLKARLLVSVPTHLFDVSHLILKVIDRPLTRHHLLLSVWARPLHNGVHFGPMLLHRGLWRPIGHVSELLRATRSHRSGFCSHPPLRLTYNCHCVCVSVCLIVSTHAHLEVHHMCSGFLCVDANACICTPDQVFLAPLLLSTGNRRLGTHG